MESEKKRFSALMNLESYPYASLLAYYLQAEKHRLRDSLGVNELRKQLHLPTQQLETLEGFNRWIRSVKESAWALPRQTGSHGTIGAVSIDKFMCLAAVTSTGGVGNEPQGRVGDTPTVSGNYCNVFKINQLPIGAHVLSRKI